MKEDGVSYMALPGISDGDKESEGVREMGAIGTDTIIDIVCEYFDLTREQVFGKTRLAEVVEARHICAYILKTIKRLSFKRIGQIMGGKDHTTILVGIKRLKGLMETEEEMSSKVVYIVSLVRGKMVYKPRIKIVS